MKHWWDSNRIETALAFVVLIVVVSLLIRFAR
jgi:hypothetical protein